MLLLSLSVVVHSLYVTEKLLSGLKDKDTIVRWSAAKGYVLKMK